MKWWVSRDGRRIDVAARRLCERFEVEVDGRGHAVELVRVSPGGAAPNSVAADCDITLDIRYLPSMDAAGILSDLEALAAKVDMPGCRFTLGTVQNALPCEVPPDPPIVRLIQQVAPDARPMGSGGGTFAKPLVHAGIQAVGWAPGHEATYHQANEEVEVAQLVTFAGRMTTLARAIASMRA